MDTKFYDAYRDLNAAQKKAVDTIDGPVLVIAGPGTGKTQLLSLRIANILQKTDTLPENILCLTFTESAAHTMRERLTRVVGQAAYGVTISTYHAFGSELLRRYPDYFIDEADLQPADDVALDATLRSVMEQLPYSNPLKHETFLRDLRQLISDAKRALLTPKDLRAIATSNEKFIREVSKQTKAISNQLARVSKHSIPAFRGLLDSAEQASFKPNTTAPIESLARLWRQSLQTALDDVDATGKTQALSKWKLQWLAKDSDASFIVDGEIVNEKIRAAATIYETYLAELQKQGLYDYDDMILRALSGLTQHSELRYTLQERYLYVLLDEYQDTNTAQARLVELLTDNPIAEGRPNVLAVGDDDQAIYAFQGAHYSHMLRFAEQYRDVLIVTLTENYRSHSDILQLAGTIAEQIEGRLTNQFSNVTKNIVAANTSLPKKAVVARHEFKSPLSQNTWVATTIQQLIKHGMTASEIAVLAPKHEFLESLVPYLRQAGVAVHYDKREDILEDPGILELISMSRLVVALQTNHSASGSLWSRVLSYTFWQVPTSILWRVSWQARDEHRSVTDVLLEYPETRSIALFFIRLAQLSSSASLEQIIDYLLGMLPLELHETNEPSSFQSPFANQHFGVLHAERTDTEGFWQLLSNLTVLREHIRAYRKTELSPLQIQDFLSFVGAHQSAGIKILNTNPYQEALEAVELMTAYRAKGQEFSVVFLLALNDEVWGSRARAMGSRLALPANLQFMRYAGATNDERLRILYVALTRARTQLYLTNFTSTYSGRPTTHLQYLNESEDEMGNLMSPLLPAGEQKILLEESSALPSVAAIQLQWHDQHLQALNQPDMKALLQPRLKTYQLSPTEFNAFLDVERDGPTTFFLQTMLRFPFAPTDSIEFGNAMHETLEWIHIQNKANQRIPTLAHVTDFFERCLRRKRLSEQQTSLLLERGRTALTAYLTQRTDTIQSTAYNEYSFRNEGVFVGDAHLNGKIDKLLVDQVHKTITIVDFKTGKSHARWDRSTKLHFYHNQLYFYKLLVERSRTFKGYSVTDAYLEFVEPNDAGEISELHIDFNDQELTKFCELISQVWQHVQNLSFPQVTHYTPDLAGVIDFESDLRSETI